MHNPNRTQNLRNGQENGPCKNNVFFTDKKKIRLNGKTGVSIRNYILALNLFFSALCACSPAVAGYGHIYRGDFETGNDFRHADARISAEKAHSGKKSLKLDTQLTKGIQLVLAKDLTDRANLIRPGKKYLLEAFFLPAKLPYHYNYQSVPKIGLNLMLEHKSGSYGGRIETDYFTPISTPQDKWTYAAENGKNIVTSVAPGDRWIHISKVISLKHNLEAHSLAIYIYGHFSALHDRGFFWNIPDNNRLTVFIDDISLRELTDAETVEYEKTQRRQIPLKKYPRTDRIFVFGVENGSFGWYSATATRKAYMTQTFPQGAWNAVWDWKTHYININTCEQGQMRPYNRERDWRVFAREMEIYERNKIYTLPAIHFNRYFFSNFTHAECEKALREAIPKFRANKAILGWWTASEVHYGSEGTNEGFFSKRIIEEIDALHPALIGDRPELNQFHPQHKYTIRRSMEGYGAYCIAPVFRKLRAKARGPVWAMLQGDESDTSRRKPTVAEIRLMTYASLAEGAKGITYYHYKYLKPRWLPGKAGRFSDIGLVNAFGAPRNTWTEIGRIGKKLLPVGPLLMSAKVVETDGLLRLPEKQVIIPGTIKGLPRDVRGIPSDFPYPVINAALLKDTENRFHILVVYSNELSKRVEGKIGISKTLLANGERIYNLYGSTSPPISGESISVNLAPGDGRLYLIATGDEFKNAMRIVDRARFYYDKEILKYKIYFVALAGINLDTPASKALEEMKKAAFAGLFVKAREKVKHCSLEIDKTLARNKIYSTVKKSVDATLDILSCADREFTAFLEARVNIDKKPPRFIDTDPVWSSYSVGLDKLGRCCLSLRALLLKGKYAEIANDAALVERQSAKLLGALRGALKGNGQKLKLDKDPLRGAFSRLEAFGKQPPVYPQPPEICEIGFFQ